jgi:hypothetical protein
MARLLVLSSLLLAASAGQTLATPCPAGGATCITAPAAAAAPLLALVPPALLVAPAGQVVLDDAPAALPPSIPPAAEPLLARAPKTSPPLRRW